MRNKEVLKCTTCVTLRNAFLYTGIKRHYYFQNFWQYRSCFFLFKSEITVVVFFLLLSRAAVSIVTYPLQLHIHTKIILTRNVYVQSTKDLSLTSIFTLRQVHSFLSFVSSNAFEYSYSPNRHYNLGPRCLFCTDTMLNPCEFRQPAGYDWKTWHLMMFIWWRKKCPGRKRGQLPGKLLKQNYSPQRQEPCSFQPTNCERSGSLKPLKVAGVGEPRKLLLCWLKPRKPLFGVVNCNLDDDSVAARTNPHWAVQTSSRKIASREASLRS